MAREVFEHIFNRGLSILRSPLRLAKGESYRAENVEFDIESVKRRKGLRAAYSHPAEDGFAVSLIKRFYHHSVDGVLRKFLLGYGGKMYIASSDWSDSSATQIDAFSQLFPPNNTTSPWDTAPTLPNLYDGSASSFTNGHIETAVQSRQWLYIQAKYQASDNANQLVNIPIRTACNVSPATAPDYDNNSFAHGLYAPQALVAADTEDTVSVASRYLWTKELVRDDNLPTNPQTLVRVNSDGEVFCMYRNSGSPAQLLVSKRTTDGVWSEDTVTTDHVIIGRFGFAIDSEDGFHVAAVDGATPFNLIYFSKAKNGTAWQSEQIASGSSFDVGAAGIAIDSLNNPHVVWSQVDAAGTEIHYGTKVGSAAWSDETVDTATSADLLQCETIVLDSSDVPHVGYLDQAASTNNLMYAQRDGGTWSVIEVVDSATCGGSVMAMRSDDAPVFGYYESGTPRVRYAIRSGGTWSPEDADTITSTPSLVLSSVGVGVDSADDSYLAYIDNTTDDLLFSKLSGGSWTTATLDDSFGTGRSVDLAIDSDDTLHVVYVDSTNGAMWYARGSDRLYYYKLTAEYDDGRLGESGPSAALAVRLAEDIDASNTNVISLKNSTTTNRYLMARDVTKLHVYRTVKGEASDSLYYRVGSVTCTYSNPNYVVDADFTDNVPDSTLVGNAILDEDVFMPPKYMTHCMWKDRIVIGNLKARELAAAEGTELDLENGGHHPNRIRFSHGFNPDRFPANYFIDVDIGGGSATVKRVIVNRRLDALMVFLEDDVIIVTGDTPLGERGSPFRPQNIPMADGTPAPESVVEDGEGNIFAWTKSGIQVFEGANARYITDNTIKPLWTDLGSSHPSYADRINRSHFNSGSGQKVVGVYVPQEEKILWSYVHGDSSANNSVLALDLTMWRATGKADGAFSIYTAWQVSKWAVWQGEGDRQELFAGESGAGRGPWVYRALFGNDDDSGVLSGTTPSTSQISSVLHLGHANFKRPDMLRKFRNLVMEADSGGAGSDSTSFAVSMNLDDSGSDTSLGAWVFDRNAGGVIRLSGGIPRSQIGRRASLKMTTTDTDSPRPWELHTISWEVEDLPGRRLP